jgi:hypothetical protein
MLVRQGAGKGANETSMFIEKNDFLVSNPPVAGGLFSAFCFAVSGVP